jgi:phosphatidylinositol alpha-1,6-mannosyltransferase
VSRSSSYAHGTGPSLCSSRLRVIGLFPELLGIGGVQEAGRQTARALSTIADEHGWELQLISLNDAHGKHQVPSCDGPVGFFGFGRRKISFILSVMHQVLWLGRDSLNLLLAAHPNLAPPASGMKRFSRSARTIVMTHGVEVWSRLSSIRRSALLHADLVVAPSGDTVEKVAAVQGVRRESIRKLGWPLSPEFLQLADRPASPQVPRSFPQGHVILTVGRWVRSERYKGIDDLIQATAELRSTHRDLHLVAVGGGDDLARVQRLAIDAGIGGSVDFLEHLSREELAACFANADVFAMPSTGEGFGLVFLEAMAFAKPIVASACGGTTDVVEHGVNGLLIPPGDNQKLIAALNSLLLDESLRAELGGRGAEMVRRKHRFEDFRIALEQILGELVPSHMERARL